jgi:hypothetical protein
VPIPTERSQNRRQRGCRSGFRLKKAFYAVEIFFHATPETGAEKLRRGDLRQLDWSLATGAGANRPSAGD